MPSHPEHSRKALQDIPGVGPSIAEDLIGLGITAVADLRERDPKALYAELCAWVGKPVDRCVLYVFRCAVWFAQQDAPAAELDPEKCQWWHWKDLA